MNDMPRYGDLDSLAIKWLLASPEQRKNFGEVIDSHPTVDVKQSEGEWIYSEDEVGKSFYRCSICDCQTRYKDNYCSSCGARMRKEDEGK